MAADEYPKVYLYRRIVHAKLFIDNHYAGAIDLDNIADEALFSKFHFIRLFKKVYGLTPHQYLIHVRIEKAMQFLRSGMAVSDTCFAVGFESLSSFSSLFKRTAGISPTDFTTYHQKMKALVAQKPLGFIPGCFAEKNGWQ
jgi:AraC-like DNA-binding protein